MSIKQDVLKLLRESEPPTAAEAHAIHALAKAADLPIAVTDLVERYAVSRQVHEQATEEAKNAKNESKELWEVLAKVLNSGPDMFAGGGA